MRLDKYLKVSRLIKRRTVANEACDSGRVLINDKPAKASANVKEGDILTISFGNKEVKVEVLDVQETVKYEDPYQMFRYLVQMTKPRRCSGICKKGRSQGAVPLSVREDIKQAALSYTDRKYSRGSLYGRFECS